MVQIYVKYNPYKLETEIKINGNPILKDSTLYKLIKGKRLQEWISEFPKMLEAETNSVDFDIEFYGMPLDWDDFEDAFNNTKATGQINSLNLKFIEGRSNEDITERIIDIFTDLKEGPIDDFRDPKLLKAFDNINNSIFPINVIATMSSGKSTLINALLSNRLMPSKNEACTATITEIIDNDKEEFVAVVYDKDNNELQYVPNLTYDIMNELNDNENVHRIEVEGDIPFIDAKSIALMLVDTPGPNNAQNQEHKNTTYRAINSNSNNLILYVLNGTQLSTNDDAALLKYVAEQIQKGGKQVRDRFLFVINKMDGFNPEEESIEKAVIAAKKYLAGYGIEDPQIFPCSAYTALNIKTHLAGVDIDNLTRAEERQLPSAARDTLPMIDKFIEYESMHLEKYSTLSPSSQRELNFRLKKAEEANDTKEQALIHCGIYSIEAAITAYVKKYSKTKKVKDLVESFQEVIESNQVLAKAKTQIATDEEMAKACVERANRIKEKIDNGEEAEVFKRKVHDLDPMPTIKVKAEELKNSVTDSTSLIFSRYGDVITDRDEAKRLISVFTSITSNSIAEMTTGLENMINQEVINTGEQLLIEYQEKLSGIDESVENKSLDFDSVDLIKGALNNMRESIGEWNSGDFAAETVEEMGETSYEEDVYYEKVGQKEEEVFDGTEKVKIGTEKVKVGSHKEWVGTRSVKNPSRSGFFGFFKFWEPSYIEKDVYETVDDYEDRDVYDTVTKYKTVLRDVFEQRVDRIEKFKVEVAVIQVGLVSKLRRTINEGIDEAIVYAAEQIDMIKKQFTLMFDELDVLIKQKYEELNECIKDQDTSKEKLESNKKILSWIETCKAEVEEVLEI